MAHDHGAGHGHREAILRDQFEIEHTTLQVDHRGGELLDIERPSNTTAPSDDPARHAVTWIR